MREIGEVKKGGVVRPLCALCLFTHRPRAVPRLDSSGGLWFVPGERRQLPTLAIPAEADRVDSAPVLKLVVELAQLDAPAAGITGARKGPSGLFPNCGHMRILRAFGEEQSSRWTGLTRGGSTHTGPLADH